MEDDMTQRIVVKCDVCGEEFDCSKLSSSERMRPVRVEIYCEAQNPLGGLKVPVPRDKANTGDRISGCIAFQQADLYLDDVCLKCSRAIAQAVRDAIEERKPKEK